MKFTFEGMDGLVKENGNLDPITSTTTNNSNSSKCISVSGQSVIQANQQSVIQTATGSLQPTVLTKGNVILVSKPNSVIQTPQGSLQTLQVVVDAGSDDEDSLSPHGNMHKKRRNILQNSSSHIKVENDLCVKMDSSGSDCDSNLDSELSSHSISMSNHYQSVIPSTEALQLSSHSDDSQGLSTIAMTASGSTPGGTILHYSGQDTQFILPGEIVVMQNSTIADNSMNSLSPEDQIKKRELRLLKNREAARECRRKKKEYIKCLENRVAVLETQNKALIDELKSLKELYCLQKND